MAKAAAKTNAMRILDKQKIAYTTHEYENDGHIDGVSVANKLGQDVAKIFKTLVTVGADKNNYVFVIPVADELDLKAAAKAVGTKSVAMIHVAEINKITGYIRGGCSPVGMKKLFKTVYHISILEQESVCVSGGKIGAQIEIAPDNLIKITNGITADIIFK